MSKEPEEVKSALDGVDLSRMTTEELIELKDAIMARARTEVGPKGFNPSMLATPDMFDPWLSLIQPVDWVSLAFRRLSLAVLTGGLGLTSAGLFRTEAGAGYGSVVLLAAGLSAVWFVVDMFRRPHTD